MCAIHLTMFFYSFKCHLLFRFFVFASRSFIARFILCMPLTSIRADVRVKQRMFSFISFHSCQLDSFAILLLINAIFMVHILAFEIQNPSGFLILELEPFATLIPTEFHISCSAFSLCFFLFPSFIYLVFNLSDCDSFHLIRK